MNRTPKRRSFLKFLAAALLLTSTPTPAQATAPAAKAQGLWIAPNHKTGEVESLIRTWVHQGKLYGRIETLIRDPKGTCEGCTGKDKNRPLEGLTIMWGFVPDDDEWTSGRILDPKTGKHYRCKLWLDGKDTLKVRAYLGPFFQTETWQRK